MARMRVAAGDQRAAWSDPKKSMSLQEGLQRLRTLRGSGGLSPGQDHAEEERLLHPGVNRTVTSLRTPTRGDLTPSVIRGTVASLSFLGFQEQGYSVARHTVCHNHTIREADCNLVRRPRDCRWHTVNEGLSRKCLYQRI